MPGRRPGGTAAGPGVAARPWLVLAAMLSLAACAANNTTVKVSGYTTAAVIAHPG